jgi:alpha-tubulin suppressor-like RCC1 family protein
MSTKYPGGVIKSSPVVPSGPYQNSSASGVWTMEQAGYWIKQGNWPTAGNLSPNLYSWGLNTNGQLGLGNITNRSSPVQVGALGTWLNIAGGNYFSLATKTDGTLWSWGYNGFGQLGLGNLTYRSSPVQVGALTTWSKIAGGYKHTLATKTNGTLWSWGSGAIYGQLGLGNTSNYSSPKQVGALTTWLNIACGRYHTIATKTDGTLWSWGSNNSGQLGLGDTIKRSSPVQVGALTTWLNIACGAYHTLANKTDGTLWSWGSGVFHGQLGLGNTTAYSSPKQVGALTTWSKIACGASYTIATKTDGTLWSWGDNQYGQLGLGNPTAYSSPKQVGALTTWSKIACGKTHTIATKTDGTLWSWGRNAEGQLGLGNITNYSSPKQVGALTTWLNIAGGLYHTLATTS